MSSKSEICNMALLLLGEQPNIVDVDTDATRNAGALKAAFDTARDALLREHNWNFALTQGTWAAVSPAPDFGYTNSYQFSADPFCLRFVRFDRDLHPGRPSWKVIGRTLRTDEGSPVYVEFIARVTDTAQFDPMFVSALAARLAWMTGYRITGKREAADEMRQITKDLARDARWADAIDTGREEPLDDGDFLAARAIG